MVFDAVDVIADVDAIGDGSFVIVFGDAILVEVGNGLRRGGGGQSREKLVEVFQHLSPEIVNGSMAFVADDEVELFDGHGPVIGDVAGARAAEGGGEFRAGDIVRPFGKFFAAQNRVEPLDRADSDAADVVDVW